VLLSEVLVSRETDSSKNTSDWFLNPSWAEEKELDVAELAGEGWKLRNCGSQIMKVRNRSSTTFFSPQLRNRFGSPQYCEVTEVRTKLRMPTFGGPWLRFKSFRLHGIT
jgi:hypothetical protein